MKCNAVLEWCVTVEATPSQVSKNLHLLVSASPRKQGEANAPHLVGLYDSHRPQRVWRFASESSSPSKGMAPRGTVPGSVSMVLRCAHAAIRVSRV